MPWDKRQLEERVISAAEQALSREKCVRVIDVLVGMRLLYAGHVEAWRKGRLEYLAPEIQGSAEKILTSLALLQRWALSEGLIPAEGRYERRSPSGLVTLKLAQDDPELDRALRTEYRLPGAAPKEEKLNDIVVVEASHDTKCAKCGAEISHHGLLSMEGGAPHCMRCVGLDGLEYLSAGNPALTRRASKYSNIRAVVVRWSRARKRYERQGLLLETPALDRAERELGLEGSQERNKV